MELLTDYFGLNAPKDGAKLHRPKFNPIPNVNSRRGAPMGRYNVYDWPEEKLHLRRVPMSGCGAYDQGGAYWGLGDPPYVAYNRKGTICVFVRAYCRDAAKTAVAQSIEDRTGCWKEDVKFLR